VRIEFETALLFKKMNNASGATSLGRWNQHSPLWKRKNVEYFFTTFGFSSKTFTKHTLVFVVCSEHF
jgi:hypothetical protein